MNQFKEKANHLMSCLRIFVFGKESNYAKNIWLCFLYFKITSNNSLVSIKTELGESSEKYKL